MVTEKTVRDIALAFPEAEEKGHFDKASFRVRNKIFMTLSSEEDAVTLKLPLDYQQMLVENEPDLFYLTGWAHQGWTRVRLKKIGKKHFQHVATIAWKNVAPKRVVKTFEEAEGR